MGGFAQGLGQGFGNVQAMSADIQARREQAELFKLKSKQLKLETDMTERQLAAQAALPQALFKGPDMQQVESQGPGAPMRLPLALSDNASGMRDGEPMWENEVKTRGPGAFEEGPRPAPGMQPIPGTEGVWANLSPQYKDIAGKVLASQGYDVNKTMDVLGRLTPGIFPKQPIQTKLSQGEVLSEYDPNTKTSRTLASGMPKEHNPTIVPPESVVLDPTTHKPIYQAPPKAEKPDDLKKRVVEVNGIAYEPMEQPDGSLKLTRLDGQAEKEARESKNPIDNWIHAHSNGKYRTMAEASDAGQHDLVLKAEETVRQDRMVERARETGRAMTAELPQREREKQEIALEKPLAQEKRANLFDRKAFLEGKVVRLPPGTTEGAAAKADVIEITDKQLADVQALDNATMDMGTLFKMGDKLITAKDWKEANFRQFPKLKGGSFTGFDSEAATYEKDVQAFSTNLARAFGHEKGVLTDQDIARWVATIPTFRDTVKTKESKKAVFNEIKENAMKAQRRVIAGDDLNAVRSELQQSVQPLLKRADAMAGKHEAPPVPEKFRHLPKEDQERWQQAYMERMQEMGAAQ